MDDYLDAVIGAAQKRQDMLSIYGERPRKTGLWRRVARWRRT
jgi:hypothetical protein